LHCARLKPTAEAPHRTVPLPDEFSLVFVGTRNVLLVVHAVLLVQSTRRDDHPEQPPHAQLFCCTCTPTRPLNPVSVLGRAPLLLTASPPRFHAERNSSEHALLSTPKRLAILHCTHIASLVVHAAGRNTHRTVFQHCAIMLCWAAPTGRVALVCSVVLAVAVASTFGAGVGYRSAPNELGLNVKVRDRLCRSSDVLSVSKNCLFEFGVSLSLRPQSEFTAWRVLCPFRFAESAGARSHTRTRVCVSQPVGLCAVREVDCTCSDDIGVICITVCIHGQSVSDQSA